MTYITRHTSAGPIIGLNEDNVEIYRGIPYAYPPIDNRRFKHAQPLTHWQGTLDATQFKSIPPQPDNKLEAFFSTQPHDTAVPKKAWQNEDCLYLNIWKPQKTSSEQLPVMIWFYGGGYINGHGSAELYDLKAFAQQAQVICISFNYRLGALGYLNWETIDTNLDGNCGLSDQYALLLWVQHLIEDFGGDKDNITLCGQSAGAISIQALMHLSKAFHLFHKAVLMSGTLTLDSVTNSTKTAQNFKQIMSQLYHTTQPTKLSTSQLMHCMTTDLNQRGPSKGLELVYQPYYDSCNMTHVMHARWPVLAGYTQDEGDCYIRNESRKLEATRFRDVMHLNHVDIDTKRFDIATGQGQSKAITHYIFKQPVMTWLHHYANPHKWLYCFQWHQTTSQSFQSAYHILDVIFWLGHIDILKAHQLGINNQTYQLTDQMMTLLSRFIHTGSIPHTPFESQQDTLILSKHQNKRLTYLG